jgi:hypothetical protein
MARHDNDLLLGVGSVDVETKFPTAIGALLFARASQFLPVGSITNVH